LENSKGYFFLTDNYIDVKYTTLLKRMWYNKIKEMISMNDYIQIPRHVAENKNISFSARMLYGVLASFPEGKYPSIRYLGELLGITAKSVHKYIKELEANGLIEVVRNENYNVYLVR
jgi:DNA-binding MarR family transcriptional regulator